MTDERCTAIASRLAEPLLATASHELAWILLEQPGSWGRNALTDSALAPEVAARLDERAKRLGVRVVLIKRTRRTPAVGRDVYLVGGGEGRAGIERATIDDPAVLLDLDLEALVRGEPTGLGEPHPAALHLVCTHGRRDACCALLGGPVARALLDARPETAWECSHVGGHRFAANVVSFPDALFFGRVAAADVVAVAAAYEGGRISLDHFRGRASHLEHVQAADGLVRRAMGWERVDDVAQLGPGTVEEDGRTIEAAIPFRLPDGEATVRVRGVPGEPRPASCGAEKLERPLGWTLLAIERL